MIPILKDYENYENNENYQNDNIINQITQYLNNPDINNNKIEELYRSVFYNNSIVKYELLENLIKRKINGKVSSYLYEILKDDIISNKLLIKNQICQYLICKSDFESISWLFENLFILQLDINNNINKFINDVLLWCLIIKEYEKLEFILNYKSNTINVEDIVKSACYNFITNYIIYHEKQLSYEFKINSVYQNNILREYLTYRCMKFGRTPIQFMISIGSLETIDFVFNNPEVNEFVFSLDNNNKNIIDIIKIQNCYVTDYNTKKELINKIEGKINIDFFI